MMVFVVCSDVYPQPSDVEGLEHDLCGVFTVLRWVERWFSLYRSVDDVQHRTLTSGIEHGEEVRRYPPTTRNGLLARRGDT